MNNTIKLLKRLHPDVLFIIDDFDTYRVLGEDTYVICYLLGFKKKGKGDKAYLYSDIKYLNYLVAKLKENEVSHMVLVRRAGYDLSIKNIYQNNTRQKYLKRGKIVQARMEKIESIRVSLKKDILNNYEKIKKVKELINNGI